MTLGSRIKKCRNEKGMSQEKVAELVGVSRQAVTKWEADQSSPSTDNLFKLAELIGTTVDLLLSPENKLENITVEQIRRIYQMEEDRKTALRKQQKKEQIQTALILAAGYLLLYLTGRLVWCDLEQSSFMGWLWLARPEGEHSYLYGWLLSSNLFWYAMAISVIAAFGGKHRFSCTTLIGFVVGLVAGMIFGPYPEGSAIGHSHYGWAIWGAIYLVSIVVGILAEKYKKKSDNKPVA